MTILVYCPNCNRPTKVPLDAAGKRVRCTGCEKTFTLPHGSGELTIEWGPAGAGRKIPLWPGKTITIGRTKDNTVSLPGPLVSRRHATLDWVNGEWRLRDPGSTNGTFVNSQRVKLIGLTDGSRIVIGDFALRLTVTTSGPSDLDRALDAMAVEESQAGIMAVAQSKAGPRDLTDSRADTVHGHVPLIKPTSDGQQPTPLLRRRRLFERWPVIAALAAVVIVIVVLLIAFLV